MNKILLINVLTTHILLKDFTYEDEEKERIRRRPSVFGLRLLLSRLLF